MLEAVGHKYLKDFFKACDQLLKPNGILALQTINIPDFRYQSYLKEVDWLKKYIFPGGHLPSLTSIMEVFLKHTEFVIKTIDNIAPHYARTLEAWRHRFIEGIDEIKKLGFDDVFIRKWIYYFSACEAAFKYRHLQDYQMILTRPNNLQISPSFLRP